MPLSCRVKSFLAAPLSCRYCAGRAVSCRSFVVSCRSVVVSCCAVVMPRPISPTLTLIHNPNLSRYAAPFLAAPLLFRVVTVLGAPFRAVSLSCRTVVVPCHVISCRAVAVSLPCWARRFLPFICRAVPLSYHVTVVSCHTISCRDIVFVLLSPFPYPNRSS